MDKPKSGDILQNSWPVILKNINVLKIKERLRSYTRLKDTNEIVTKCNL